MSRRGHGASRSWQIRVRLDDIHDLWWDRGGGGNPGHAAREAAAFSFSIRECWIFFGIIGPHINWAGASREFTIDAHVHVDYSYATT